MNFFLPKPFLCSVCLQGTESWALLLQLNVHLCVFSSQWLSVSSFVRASHALHWKVTCCTPTCNFTRMLNLTLPVRIKWSRIHSDCWRNPLSCQRSLLERWRKTSITKNVEPTVYCSQNDCMHGKQSTACAQLHTFGWACICKWEHRRFA